MNNAMDLYLKEVADLPPHLSREEEVDIFMRIKQGDKSAEDRLIKANLRFVISIAKRYVYRGIDLEDLVAEGNVGMIKAIHKYDETRGLKFISYAVWWIRQAILESVHKHSKTVRTPIRLFGEEGVNTHISLEESGLDGVLEHPAPLPDENAIDITSKKLLEQIMNNALNPRECHIISEYFGLNGNRPKTLEQIGKELYLTRERVRQVKNRALEQMERAMRRKRIAFDHLIN